MTLDTAMLQAAEYISWSAEHGGQPTRSDTDKVEYRLNRWLNTYRNLGTPYKEVNSLLVKNLGASIVETREEKSARMARMYVSFCMKHDRYPCMRLDKDKDNIRRLVTWFDSYRRGVKNDDAMMVEYEKTTVILKRYLGNRIFESDRIFKIYNRPEGMGTAK